jgi:renalase
VSIAIIGAGMSGLSAAEVLSRSGRTVRLFDKGRSAGGRMATRRTSVNGADLTFDHGAQYFTARSPEFRAEVSNWLERGVAARWDDDPPESKANERYIGAPCMNSVLKAMAAPLDVSWSAEVAAIEGKPGTWSLRFPDGSKAGQFETVIVAVPAEQAATLLAPVSPALSANAQKVRSEPCWAVMLAYAQPTRIVSRSFEPEDGPLVWTARNSSKFGRTDAETWVLHARPDWSAAHIEAPPEKVAEQLVDSFREQTGAGEPDFAQAHRWRYARVAQPLGTPFQHEAASGLATCGDWHLGARVEAAWTSGRLLAAELLR